jgi:hypothetical protein
MTFLFNSQSDYYHIGIRLHFLTATCGQVRLDIGAKKICFDILLADSKMTTSSGPLVAYCDVHHVSRMVSFIGWCQSTSLKA